MPPSPIPDPAVRPHRGGVIVTLGALGLFTAFILLPVGILAWILGMRDLKAMDEGHMDPSGRTLTQVGWVLGVASATLGLGIWTLVALKLLSMAAVPRAPVF